VTAELAVADDRSWRVELRYRAVLDVAAGTPVADVARRYGASRQSVYAWRSRYAENGLDGLRERSRRPVHSPGRLEAETEALICELRREHRRWGARRIVHELIKRGVTPRPSRSTVYRALVRNGLVVPQEQRHKRVYKRWQREAPMDLWQMDIMSGVFLAGGRECKLVTGIDDHSRYIVIAKVVSKPTGRIVTDALAEAIERYGVPSEVLTDNGKQFTGRFTKPMPAEVLFEQFCRTNGITQRLTKRRSPTTIGKIERFHGTLRTELLDEVEAFADQDTAQAAIDAWVEAYNTQRPHQALDMRVPADCFRPAAARTTPAMNAGTSSGSSASAPSDTQPAPGRAPTAALVGAGEVRDAAEGAVAYDIVVPPAGCVNLVQKQQLWLGPALSGRMVTLWLDQHSIHASIDGAWFKTVASQLCTDDLQKLRDYGARTAGPAPAPPALPTGRNKLPAATVIDVDRSINRYGVAQLAGNNVQLGADHAGQRVTFRLDGHLLHAIVAGKLIKTMPAPIPPDQRAGIVGARRATSPTPPAPSGPLRAQRRVPTDGITMVARQRLRIGRQHAGKTVEILIEDTHYRVLHNGVELSIHPRKHDGPVRHFRAYRRSPSP
jgi:transposase InsO family protein